MTVAVTPPVTDWKNLLGVCACLGEDFGFNPIYLRIAFGMGLIWAPVADISIYLVLGAVVLLSRLVAPNRRSAAPAVAEAVSPVAAQHQLDALPLAA